MRYLKAARTLNIDILKQRLPVAALIAANLLPLYGVLAWGWKAELLIVLYWAENLIIGFYTIVKMLYTSLRGIPQLLAGLFSSGFFLLHYGGFVAIHGLFVMEMTGFGGGADAAMGSPDMFGPLVFLALLFNVIHELLSHMDAGLALALAGLALSHGVSLVINFLIRGEHRNTNSKKVMFSPYGRIVVLHIALIAGGFFVISSHSPLPLLIILVTLKIGMDILFHLRAHKKTSAQ